MGYTFKVGNLVEVTEDDATGWDVEYEKHEAAPAFGEPTDNTNARWPSYIGWSNFCRDTDLYEFFYTTNDNLRMGHPGYVQITQDDVDLVHAKLYEYSGKVNFEEWNLNRLIWLDYWMTWAIKNCKNPGIFNN